MRREPGPDMVSVFIYIVMACLALEACVLLFLWRRRRVGLRPIQTLSFLGAGGSFSAALLVVAKGGSMTLLGACLFGAFIFHVLDLVLRWRT